MRNVGFAIRSAKPLATIVTFALVLVQTTAIGQQNNRPATAAAAQAGPTPEQLLAYRPVQPDVEIDQPEPAEIAKCVAKKRTRKRISRLCADESRGTGAATIC